MQFIFNFDSDVLITKLIEVFKSSDEVNIAVGFIGYEGLLAIQPEVEALVARGGKFQLIAGMHGAKGSNLTFDQLKVLWNLNNHRRDASHPERIKLGGDRSYHGKLYLFNDKNKGTIFIGSSNLSEAGLGTRYEANVILEGSLTDDAFKDCSDAFRRLWDESSILSQQNITVVTLPKSIKADEEVISAIQVEDPKLEAARLQEPFVFTLTENNLSEGGRPRINEAYLNANKKANDFFGGAQHEFQVITDDRYTFRAMISGYGTDRLIGKNLRSRPSNKDMGIWLKTRKNAIPNDQVFAYKIPGEEDIYLFEFHRN